MKPIVAFGHSRPITKVIVNSDGDLIVSASKDATIALWNINNLECYGTCKHEGTVWDIDIYNYTIISASADFSLRVWYNGELKNKKEFSQPVRSCQFSTNGTEILLLLEKYGKQQNQIVILDRDCNQKVIFPIDSDNKSTISKWGPLDETILVGYEDGKLLIFNRENELIKQIFDHEKVITDIQFSMDKSHFITSSKDHTARLYDYNLTPLKVYKSDRPVNSASISTRKEHVILGGGQDAYTVLI
eukprot:NODE_41_length_34096_cov_2.002235.p18 type:complete len:245 gc:universal NODE_41_length_34096_cov_2.002235:21221-20487(-)